jgi:RecB family exonuclease
MTRWVAEKLVGVLDTGSVHSDTGVLHPGLDGPLALSYSRISSYLHCPRCYLVEQVFRLQSDESVHTTVGTAVHEALEQFYQRWREADAEGDETPGVVELRELVQARFWQHWPRDVEVERGQLEQLDAMVEMYWEKLHRDDAHIEEIEKESTLAYECDGVRHTIRAKLDRVDLGVDGGRRVVDYKTGSPRKKLVEPQEDDLQLGIYAMVLLEELGDPGPGSTCEYWCLQDGSRGVIGFDALNMKKIRRQIDKAIRGIQSGDWARSRNCKGDDAPCTILDKPGFVFSDTVREETRESCE